MDDIFESMLRTDETESDEFRSDTDLTLYIDDLADGEEAHGPDSINLTYTIYVEFRSWGIKDIAVSSRGKIEFEVEIVDAEDNEVDTITVSIDAEDIKLQWVSGAGYAPESLEVRADRTGKLIDAELNFYFQDHS